MLDPERYLSYDSVALQSRYVEVSTQLGSLYLQLHDAEVAEKKTFEHGFYTAEESTIAAKDRYARSLSLDMWITTQDCKTDIKVLETELDLLLKLIEWNNG